MFKIYDGRSEFYQWDLDRKIVLSDPTIKEVHFCNKTSDCSLVVTVYEEDGLRLANVPNILLQADWPIKVYAYCGDCYTKTSTTFKVIARSRPDDYVYTETEVKRWEDYVTEVAALTEQAEAAVGEANAAVAEASNFADKAEAANKAAEEAANRAAEEASDAAAAIAAEKAGKEAEKLISELGIVQEVGKGTVAVMSQKAVCDTIGITWGKNLFNKNDPDIILGSVLNASGGVQTVTTGNYPTTEYYISGYVPVEAGKVYSLTKVPAIPYCACFYDASKTFVSSVTMSSINIAGYKVTIPDGVSYMRITDRQTNLDIQQIEEGTKITAYEPYYCKNPIAENTERIAQTEKDIDALSTKIVKNYEIDEGVVIDKLNNLADWKVHKYPSTDNPSEVVEETTLTKYGKALKFKSRVKPSQIALYKRVSYDFTNVKKTFSLWVYHDRVYENCFVGVRLYNGAYGDANSAYCTVYSNKLYKGWHLVTFNEVDFVVADGFDWSNIQTIAVIAGITESGDDEYTVIINDLRVGKEWTPKIIFRFDDGLKGVYQNAEPALRARGMSGIVYCNTLFNERADNGETDPVTNKPYSEGYCTTAELLEMYNNGFDISNHSRSHFTFVDKAAHYEYADTDNDETKRTSVLYQIKKGQNWLINKGFVKSARHFAVPGGHDTELCQQALIDCGVLTSGNSVHDDFIPNNNSHKIPAWGIANTTTIDEIKGWISDAVLRERTVVLMFHDILDELLDVANGGYSEIRYQYLTSDFEAILDWIVEQGWAGYVTNMSDWYEGLNRGDGR